MTSIDIAVTCDRTDEWTTVCSSDRLRADRGVCALVSGVQVALFRTSLGELFAVGNRDPFSGANVISRGIVGSAMGRCVVTSPMFKQRFDLETGVCVEDPQLALPVHSISERDGAIMVMLGASA
jgi:nitrite reductase (NADH) small subunit